jgi:Ca-activated chloride channel homolog
MNDQQKFQQWVEAYLGNTITPEEAQQLLEMVQNDPEKLKQLSRQIQADRLLSLPLHEPAHHEIAQKVLQQIEAERQSKVIRPAFWSTRTISRIAASLVILLSLTVVLKQLSKQERIKSETYSVVVTNENKDTVADPSVTKEQPKEEPRSEELDADLAEDKGSEQLAGSAPQAQLAPPQSPPKMALNSPKLKLEKSIPHRSLFAAVGSSSSGIALDGNVVSCFGFMPEPQPSNTERYANVAPSSWKQVSTDPLSTFSIDVDTASYANIRRYLNQGSLPPTDAVRIEEMINYFEYAYPQPDGAAPFSSSMALHRCPWNENHHLLRIGLQGKSFDAEEAKPSNLVFLLDVSGSMNSADKLPLLKQGFEKMVNQLGANDRVAIVAYAGASGLVLPSTPASDKQTIISSLNRLQSGGSTAGGAGIELAYRVAADHFIKGGVNRVILASDGDFNVGTSDLQGLQKLIEEKRKSGVFLSVLGFGTGNVKDDTMEMLANKGNGNYYYIDSAREADKVLVRQLRATLVTIAKDVKIQVEFNPALIHAYRLIGYENRALANRDFADDTKDAGEIGAGHQVTALYELIPIDAPNTKDGISLKYGATNAPVKIEGDTAEFLTLNLRYKEPEGDTSRLLTFPLERAALNRGEMDESFRWAASIAAFGEKLRGSDHATDWSLEALIENATGALGADPYGYRKEALDLMKRAAALKAEPDSTYPQWQFRN